MHDVHLVQALQPLRQLNENLPYLSLAQLHPPLSQVMHLAQQIPIVRILHNYAQRLRDFIQEGSSIAYDVFVADGGKEAHLVQGILSLLFIES